MKKMLILASMMVMTISAAALPFSQAQQEAYFLTDKMAYELGLNAAQYEMAYEINLDYFLSVNNYNDLNGVWWARRNADLRYILTTYQYNRFISLTYFYRPLVWRSTGWFYPIRTRYTNHSHFYNHRPNGFVSYRGGHNRMGHDFYANRPGGHHGNPGGNHGHNHGNVGGNPGNHGGNPGGSHGNNNFNNGGNHGNIGGGHNNPGGNHGNVGGNHNSNPGNGRSGSINRSNNNNNRSRVAGR